MKKFLALVLVAVVVLTYPKPMSLASLASYVKEGSYSLYLSGYANSPYAVRLDNGGDTILVTDVARAEAVLKGREGVIGETVSFAGAQAELEELLSVLRLSVVSSTRGSVLCIYGKSSVLPQGIKVDGREINCQIVVAEGRITVGYPLIMGSYDLGT